MSQGDDLSEENLINDTITVLNYINEKYPLGTIIVIGHSMGGSVATKTCEEIFKNHDKYKDLYDKIQGLMVIDVVEGTAMEALPFMEILLIIDLKIFLLLKKELNICLEVEQLKIYKVQEFLFLLY